MHCVTHVDCLEVSVRVVQTLLGPSLSQRWRPALAAVVNRPAVPRRSSDPSCPGPASPAVEGRIRGRRRGDCVRERLPSPALCVGRESKPNAARFKYVHAILVREPYNVRTSGSLHKRVSGTSESPALALAVNAAVASRQLRVLTLRRTIGSPFCFADCCLLRRQPCACAFKINFAPHSVD